MLKTLLGISDLEDDVDELQVKYQDLESDLEKVDGRIRAVTNELEEIHDAIEGKVDQEDLESRVQDVVDELEFLQEDEDQEEDNFSPTEKQILRVMFHADGFVEVGENPEKGRKGLADELDKSPGTVRKYMSMLKDRIELSTRKDGRKTLYRLPTQVQDEILEGSREISLTNS